MKRRTTMLLALTLLASFAVVSPAAASGGHGPDATYRITVENLNENQQLTPVVVATHRSGFRLFKVGRAATSGLQQLAENGGVPALVDELGSSSKVGTVAVLGSGPIAPGGEASSVIRTGGENIRLSLAAMLICTNDGFTGSSSIRLPSRVGQERTFYARSYDAGTEINTQSYVDLVSPCDQRGESDATNPALAENGVVRRHAGIIDGVGDLTVADHGWDDPVLKITVERVATYQVSITNLTDGQSLTPAVFATHHRWASVFDEGRPASYGLQQLAENGGVPVLLDELSNRRGFGTVAAIGDAPVAAGTTVSAEIVVDGPYRRVSLAAMLICTNDGFGGVDSLRLPRRVGDQVDSYGFAYDAGTEVNTEAFVDLVQPCDGKGGSGATNPNLAEGGVVHDHAGIVGGADLDPATHGWDGPVLELTIERTS